MLKIENKEKIDPEETVYDFFLDFFTRLPATYDEEGNLQCKKGKLRTYDDILRIFKYYYTDVDEYMLNRTLKTLIVRHIINCVYCGEIGRVTYFPYNYENREYFTYRTFFIPMGGQLHFSKRGTLSRYSGYNKDFYESTSEVGETVRRLKVMEPTWD